MQDPGQVPACVVAGCSARGNSRWMEWVLPHHKPPSAWPHTLSSPSPSPEGPQSQRDRGEEEHPRTGFPRPLPGS